MSNRHETQVVAEEFELESLPGETVSYIEESVTPTPPTPENSSNPNERTENVPLLPAATGTLPQSGELDGYRSLENDSSGNCLKRRGSRGKFLLGCAILGVLTTLAIGVALFFVLRPKEEEITMCYNVLVQEVFKHSLSHNPPTNELFEKSQKAKYKTSLKVWKIHEGVLVDAVPLDVSIEASTYYLEEVIATSRTTLVITEGEGAFGEFVLDQDHGLFVEDEPQFENSSDMDEYMADKADYRESKLIASWHAGNDTVLILNRKTEGDIFLRRNGRLLSLDPPLRTRVDNFVVAPLASSFLLYNWQLIGVQLDEFDWNGKLLRERFLNPKQKTLPASGITHSNETLFLFYDIQDKFDQSISLKVEVYDWETLKFVGETDPQEVEGRTRNVLLLSEQVNHNSVRFLRILESRTEIVSLQVKPGDK